MYIISQVHGRFFCYLCSGTIIYPPSFFPLMITTLRSLVIMHFCSSLHSKSQKPFCFSAAGDYKKVLRREAEIRNPRDELIAGSCAYCNSIFFHRYLVCIFYSMYIVFLFSANFTSLARTFFYHENFKHRCEHEV